MSLGRNRCRFHEVSSLDFIVRSHCANVMFGMIASWGTMAPLVQPLIGGRVFEQSSRRMLRLAASDTSHLGAATVTPRACSCAIILAAALDEAPDRDGTIKCFAPRSAIQFKMARPRPPDPPAIRYEAFSSNVQGRCSWLNC